MYTTLNAIREHHPCKAGWEKLLKYLGKTSPDDEPLSLLTILESNGLYDTLWCFCAVDGFEKERLLLSVTYAKEVEHLMHAESKNALDVFERYANGLATQEEFDAARAATDAAARVAARAATDAAARVAARVAARAAAHASWAWAAASAARAAAHASWAAARADADAAWSAADAAASAAAAATARVAFSTIQAKQETQLRQLLERTCTQL